MENQTYNGQSRTAPFEEMQPGNRLTTLGKLLNTDTQVIVLYEKIMTRVPEKDRDARLVDAEASAEISR